MTGAPPPFSITPTPPTSIKLVPGHEGKFSFTVQSLAAPDKTNELILQAQVVDAAGVGKEVDWLVPGPSRTLSMTGGETETVTIVAHATTPPGTHNIKLIVASKAAPNDDFVESSIVTCEGSGGSTPPPPPPPWWKRWWWVGVIVGVVALGGGGLIAWKLTRPKPLQVPGLGDPCDAARTCDRGLVCTSGKCQLASKDCVVGSSQVGSCLL